MRSVTSTRQRRMRCPHVLRSALVSAPIVMACTDRDRGPNWEGTLDTLADGRISVHSPAMGLRDGASAWQLVEELRIGAVDGTGPDVFSAIAGIDVDARGRIWVLDRDAAELSVFDANGVHVRTLGRRGEGPGELRDPIGIALDRSARAWVVDPGNARYTVFDSAGVHVGTHLRRITGYIVPWRGGFDTQQRLVEVASVRTADGYSLSLVRHRPDTGAADTIPVPQYDDPAWQLSNADGSITATVPFAPSLVWTFHPDGSVWSGVNAQYRIHQLSFAGDTLRTVSRDYDPIPVTSAERDTAIARMRWFTSQGGTISPNRIPGRKPAFSRIDAAPDGHLWISVTTPARATGSTFDVFDPVGRYLGVLPAPTPLRRGVLFRNDRIYGVTSDSLGVNYVVRLRLVRPLD